MYPYDGMVLCQYRDITERSQRKLELEREKPRAQRNTKGRPHRKLAIRYPDTKHTSVMQAIRASCVRKRCKHINMDNYLELILPEDRKSFHRLAERKPERQNGKQRGLPHPAPRKRFSISASRPLPANGRKTGMSLWKDTYRTSPTYSNGATTSIC